MKVNWKASLVWLIGGTFVAASGYISGHSAAMHQHASNDEIDKMVRDENGKINYHQYLKKAFQDYKKVQEDPCGFNRTV